MQAEIISTTGQLLSADRWDTFQARVGINRSLHRVKPGLYALGSPNPDSPVFVTANYKLSFNALRSSLKSVDSWILVLDTHGINVWCAAGKGTFGTEELVKRIELTNLKEIVRTRVLILPQLGATGVAAHLVKKRTGFKVEYGPVRAEDLQGYLKIGEVTPQMRVVRFAMRDRLVLIPVDIVNYFLPTLVGALILYFLGGWFSVLAVICAVLAGVVLFPILLPWLPSHDFSVKGYTLGLIVMLPFIYFSWTNSSLPLWAQVLRTLPLVLGFPVVTAFISLNFTGTSTFTSRTGVKKEIFAYIPAMAWMAGISVVVTVGLAIWKSVGG
jgi:CO dehydrogenase/acetyl-CoA synthase delta subunit